jgi:Domain of unknown function (DUF5916)/Carbohydrate family 9 binding domain-like
MKLFVNALIISIIFPQFVFSQTGNYTRERPSLEIKKAKAAIKIDGIIDEIDWLEAQQTSKFHQLRPYDSSFALLQTEVKVTFDDKNLYIYAKCFEPKSLITISSLKRDFEGGSSDVFSVNIDTFKDRLNGFQFAVSPYNVQREGLIVNTDENQSNFWDNKWNSQVKIYDDFWVVEMAIPFKSIRYKISESNIWGINFGRNTLKNNEVSTWSPVPRNFRPSTMAYGGDLIWVSPPPIPGANISLIPYISGGRITDYNRNDNLELGSKTNDNSSNIGGDVKIGIGPSLNLDLTFNPDFSNVDVDQQVTNLDRFELFYPERRQFFLENSDLFGTFGFPNTRPFFSRRIGIANNPLTGGNESVKILAGARLSGKINNNLRIGLMNAQTQKIDFGNNQMLPSANYTVATVQQKVFERSTISAIFSNKSLSLGDFSEIQKADYEQYNRVGGLEFNYFSRDNKLQSETYYHQSFSPDKKGDASSIAHYMGFNHPNIDLNLGVSRVGENYNADMGFVPRNGILSIYWPMELRLNPKNPKMSKLLNIYGFGMYETEFVYDLKGKLLDSRLSPYLHFGGPAGNSLFFGYGSTYTYLFSPFDPTNSSLNPNPDASKAVKPLPIGDYRFGGWFIGYESSQRNNFSGEFTLDNGNFFNGKSTGFSGSLQYRVQPIGVFSIDYNYNDIRFPKPYNQVKYWLIGPKAEISFSKSVFFTNYFQYNTQTNNFNINSRLQWRFKPVSDIFLVYSDNRFAEEINKYNVNTFAPKNRALVFKMTYWFNV